MKLCYIYCHPSQSFQNSMRAQIERLARVQIDNSLELGWHPDDIYLLTNFPYTYNGVSSRVIPNLYFDVDPVSSKVRVLAHLLGERFFEDDLYWVHDFDVYQHDVFSPPDVRVFAGVRYNYKRMQREWQCGSFFFRPNMEAAAFFKTWYEEIMERVPHSRYVRSRPEEKVLRYIVAEGKVHPEELNVRYNVTPMFLLQHNNPMQAIEHPIVATHFHVNQFALEYFCEGKNPWDRPLVPTRLTRLMKKHGLYDADAWMD